MKTFLLKSHFLTIVFLLSSLLFGTGVLGQTLSSVTISAPSGTATYGITSSVTYTVTASRSSTGNNESVSFTVGTIPGVSAEFTPTSVSYGNGSNGVPQVTSTLTVTTTTTSAARNNQTFTVTGTITGGTAKTATGSLTINKATPTATLAVSNTPQTYTGSGQAATVTISASSVSGAVSNILTGGAATQTNAATYAVTANFVPIDTANYNSLLGLSAGNFVIGKATPTATLAVSNTPQTYTGSGQAATVTISASSVSGAVSNILTGGATTQTNAATYAVTANFIPTDTANYNSLLGLSAGNFVIGKATPTATLAVSNTPQTYTGSGQAATVTISASSVSGAVSNILTGGAATQTNAATYAVTANFIPTDTANYNSLLGLSAGNFVIGKATPTATLAVSNTPQTYTGSGQAATVTISASSVSGAVSNILTGGAATQTNAATYAVTANFIPTDIANYNSLLGLSAGNFVIGKATPTATLAVSNTPQTYTSSGQSATVAISASSVPGAVSNILTGGAATQTNAATYAVTANFIPTDTANYNSLLGLSAGNFVIGKATPTVNWNNPADIVYGTALSGTQLNATVSAVAGFFVYTPATNTVLNAGNAQTLSVNFTPTDTVNYNSVNGTTVQINVNKADQTIVWNNPADIVYGAALGATQLNAEVSGT
ncbi:beta strand repeat-containing protein, partial [Flavobacterium yafengii]